MGAQDDSINASLQHIERLRSRRATLQAAEVEAELQVCHRIGQAYRDRELGWDDLVLLYEQFRVDAAPGFTKRWNESVPVKAQSLAIGMRGEWQPNGPGGSYYGRGRPGPHDSAPMNGQAVVYILYDDLNEPAYIGSTYRFRSRLHAHEQDGKPMHFWTATPCRSREDAYALEDRLLKDVMPYLNRRRGA